MIRKPKSVPATAVLYLELRVILFYLPHRFTMQTARVDPNPVAYTPLSCIPTRVGGTRTQHPGPSLGA